MPSIHFFNQISDSFFSLPTLPEGDKGSCINNGSMILDPDAMERDPGGEAERGQREEHHPY